jgi:hypothetical protein
MPLTRPAAGARVPERRHCKSFRTPDADQPGRVPLLAQAEAVERYAG